MKKLTILSSVLLTSLIGTCQSDNNPYLVGSENIKGYPIEVRYYEDKITLKCCPALATYIKYKDLYIGGRLEDKNTDSITEIIDIKFICNKHDYNKSSFLVIGKNFNRSFTFNNGEILAEFEDFSVFNTKDVGIWKICRADNWRSTQNN